MTNSSQRKVKRSEAWPDTWATLKVDDSRGDKRRGSIIFKGIVGDLSSQGMFFKTDEAVPVPARAEIKIDFDPTSNGNRSELLLNASGKTVRKAKDGVGIQFTAIDLTKLQRCITTKMNRAAKD